jgi:hypothetical protein
MIYYKYHKVHVVFFYRANPFGQFIRVELNEKLNYLLIIIIKEAFNLNYNKLYEYLI